MKNLLFIFALLCGLLSSCKHEQLNIVPIPQLSKIDSIENAGAMTSAKFDYFLVEGYQDTKDVQNKIDSFVERAKADNPSNFFQYDMIFYKKSDKTNIESIAADRRLIDRYSQEHDLIYSYSWSKGQLVSKMKFKNGRPTNRS